MKEVEKKSYATSLGLSSESIDLVKLTRFA